jgi:hypothetical protein
VPRYHHELIPLAKQKRETLSGFPSYLTGAGEESRTLDLNLGKVALYQLSYSRIFAAACLTQTKPKLEREKSLELSTSTLARLRSTN